ncbi:aminoacyl-tRNA hydrolase [Micrococcoides hystricis]|uniref:Peptidyl-tRNA hydrolase n=1 Tax=Micrococcoides hystricis TaxID=1572761 RepID=A0ABV6PAB4_9MICC
MSADTYLVVGLGNPGPDYARTRHNIGHMVVDELADRHSGTFTAHKSKCVQASVRIGYGGPKMVLAKTTSYMNVSGPPVAALMKFLSLGPENLIVVHDEVDIAFDAIKLKRGGSEGGHNGLKDISRVLGTRDYLRVRAGIGRPPGRMDTAKYVLQPFNATERETLPLHLDRCADAVEALITDGLTTAQNKFH